MAQKNKRRNWCWTLNNYTDEEKEFLNSSIGLSHITYLCYGAEIGANGTPHLQGYLECSIGKELKTLKNLGGCFSRIHFDPRRGTQKQAIDYCKKGEQTHQEWNRDGINGLNFGLDAEFVEFGELKTDGKQNLVQNTLVQVKKKIQEGATRDEIFDFDANIATRYDKWVRYEINRIVPADRLNLSVAVFHGEPGTGKSRYAWHLMRQHGNYYSVPIQQDKTSWFDGYDGQKCVLFEDFSGAMKLNSLLRLLDVYPAMVPFKGGYQWFVPERIIFTTNIHVKDWYNWEKRLNQRKALRRRIHVVLDFDDLTEDEELEFKIGKSVSLEDYWYIE